MKTVELKEEDAVVVRELDLTLAQRKIELADFLLLMLSRVGPVNAQGQQLQDKVAGFAKVYGVDTGGPAKWRYDVKAGAFVTDTE